MKNGFDQVPSLQQPSLNRQPCNLVPRRVRWGSGLLEASARFQEEMAFEEDLRQKVLPPLDLELGFCIVDRSQSLQLWDQEVTCDEIVFRKTGLVACAGWGGRPSESGDLERPGGLVGCWGQRRGHRPEGGVHRPVQTSAQSVAGPHCTSLPPPPQLIRSGGGRKSRRFGQLLARSNRCPEHLSPWEPLPGPSLHHPRPPSGGIWGAVMTSLRGGHRRLVRLCRPCSFC